MRIHVRSDSSFLPLANVFRLIGICIVLVGASCAPSGKILISQTEAPAEEPTEIEEGDGPPPTYTITLPEFKRKVWVADEVAPRTITFTHNATGVSCSRDGGVTYGTCSGVNTYVWKAKNYEVEHKIRFYTPGSQFAIYTFKPSELFPGRRFVNCDANLSGNISFTSFQENMNRASDRTLCLSNATYIENTGAESALTLTKDNITIITRNGYGAYVKSGGISSVFDLGSTSGFTLVGTDIEMNYDANDRFAIKGHGGDSVVIDTVNIENIGTTGNDGPKLILIESGFSAEKILINNSTLTAGSGVALEMKTSSSKAEVVDSTLTGKRGGLFTSGQATITSSTLGSNGSAANCYSVQISGGNVTMTDAKIYDSSGRGAVYFGVSSGTLTMTDTTIRRTFSNGGFSAEVFVEGTGTPHTVNGSGNLFCNETVNPNFTGITSSNSISGTAITGAVLYACPADTSM